MTSPRPSRFGGRDSRRTTWGSGSRSSAASSIVTTRSAGSTNAARAPSVVVLPEPVPPQIEQRAAGGDGAAEEVEQRRRQRPVGDEVGGREPARAEAADGEQRPVERERRQHDVDARAVGQAGVAQRLGLVGPPPERREDPLDHVAQLGLAGEPHAGLREPPAALDPHGLGPADEQLVDAGVAQQRLERPESDGPLGDPRGERGARARVEHAGLALDERADPRTGVVAALGVAGRLDEAVAQRAGERVERAGRRIGWVHDDR